MRINKSFSLLLLASAVWSFSFSQTTKQEPVSGEGNYNLFQQIGESFVKKGEFYNSIPYLKKAYAKDRDKTNKANLMFKIAESYRELDDMKNAEEWYSRAVKAGFSNPMAVLRLAEAQKVSGKYAEALENFKRFKALVPEDARGNSGITSSELSKGWVSHPTKHVVENVEQINSRYMDFNLVFSRKNTRLAYFTSSRETATGTEQDGWTGQKYTDLFQTLRDDKGKWSTPQPLPAPINSPFTEGAATLDKSGNNLFFTKCLPNKIREGNCNLYVARRKGEGWDNPKPLNIVPDSITIGHPALSPDERTLYFSSNMAGGYGGKDIWMSVYDVQHRFWSKPINLGPKINTVGDEMYPFIANDGTLYFSSNAHVGMGGLDIFKTKFTGSRTAYAYKNNPGNNPMEEDTLIGESPLYDLTLGTRKPDTIAKQVVDSLSFYAQQWLEPENLKYPMNSSYDDFGIIFEEGPTEMGYLSSNREGGKGFDDIYRFRLPALEFTIQGKVMDIDSRGGVKGASVELLGNDGSIVTVKTDKRGVYIFDRTMVKANTVYKITAAHKNYLSAKGIQSTVGLNESTDLFQDAFLLKSTLKPITIPDIYYDLDKATLRPESKKNLDSLVTIFNDNPKLVVRIAAHTDSRGSDEHNNDLSQRRAESVVDYLISKGVDPERLEAKGYGKTKLKITDEQIARMKEADREKAHAANRRTEFEKVRDDYVPRQRFEAPTRDSLGKNIKIGRPILSSKDSVFFNLKNDKRPAQPGNTTPAQQPAQQPSRKDFPVMPGQQPEKRDTVPTAPPTPE